MVSPREIVMPVPATASIREELVVEARWFRASKGWRGPAVTVHDYVLWHGREYPSLALTPEELERALRAVDRAGPPRSWRRKKCFYNAQRIAMFGEDPGLRYVEGYVRCGGGLLIDHAWATLDAKVLDLTMRRDKRRGHGRFRDRVLGTFEDRAYFGVELDTRLARERIVETGTSSPLLNDWERDWPLLRREAESRA